MSHYVLAKVETAELLHTIDPSESACNIIKADFLFSKQFNYKNCCEN